MASGHRVPTDRKQALLIGTCGNDCTGVELEVEGQDESVDQLIEKVKTVYSRTCEDCGCGLSWMMKEEPVKRLD